MITFRTFQFLYIELIFDIEIIGIDSKKQIFLAFSPKKQVFIPVNRYFYIDENSPEMGMLTLYLNKILFLWKT